MTFYSSFCYFVLRPFLLPYRGGVLSLRHASVSCRTSVSIIFFLCGRRHGRGVGRQSRGCRYYYLENEARRNILSQSLQNAPPLHSHPTLPFVGIGIAVKLRAIKKSYVFRQWFASTRGKRRRAGTSNVRTRPQP